MSEFPSNSVGKIGLAAIFKLAVLAPRLTSVINATVQTRSLPLPQALTHRYFPRWNDFLRLCKTLSGTKPAALDNGRTGVQTELLSALLACFRYFHAAHYNRLHGGLNGLAERTAYWELAKHQLEDVA